MKTIDEMFPPQVNFKKKLNVAGIKIPDSFRFSDVNIVIGKNGAGKTRLLHALKSLYESESMGGTVDLIYGYFPGLSDRLVKKKSDLPEHELREFLDQPDVSFDDFFKEIETQSMDFLTRLLEYHSRRQKQKNENILKAINDFFYPVTEKRLIKSEKTPDGKIIPFLAKDTERASEIFAVLEPNGKVIDLETEMERFSPGERLLLYMAIFFALRRDDNRERIIILDEPETHLHPQALLRFACALTENSSHTTIWIATHSLFLLPLFRFENIVYMANDSIVPRNSHLYETILAALLGENSKETRRFFSSLPSWQYVEFLTECFATPKVIDTVDPKDEQVSMFIEALKTQQIHRILDCGGGNARLGLSLKAAGVNLEYDIYDISPSYTGDEFTTYTRIEDIKGSYDCVVMMNFLHEVDPDDWPKLFRNMRLLLNPNGFLLFVEVAALAEGEWPNETGYMVLGKKELETLFNAPNSLSEIRIRNNQKSVGVLVPRQLLTLVTKNTVSRAIKQLEERVYNELKQIRVEESERRKAADPKDKRDKNRKPLNARRYAFLSQQYMNAKFFNDKIVPNHLQQTHPVINKNELLKIDFQSATIL